MANTITHTPQTCTITNAVSGTTAADIKYVPTLSTTWVAGASETFSEGEYNNGTTTHTQYLHILYDDLVTKYGK